MYSNEFVSSVALTVHNLNATLISSVALRFSTVNSMLIRSVALRLVLRKFILAIRASSTETAAPTLP